MDTDAPPSRIVRSRSTGPQGLDLIAWPTRLDGVDVDVDVESVTADEAFAVPRFARTCRMIAAAKRRRSSSPLGSGSAVTNACRPIASGDAHRHVAAAHISWAGILRNATVANGQENVQRKRVRAFIAAPRCVPRGGEVVMTHANECDRQRLIMRTRPAVAPAVPVRERTAPDRAGPSARAA